MTMNYKEVSQRLSKEEAARYATGIQQMADLADSLQKQGLLPVRFGARESLPTLEQLVLRPRFTDRERKKLLADKAKAYLLSRTTILQQKEARAAKGQPSFWHITDGGDRLLALPSRDIEVAFFPDPNRFFVEGTFGKDTNTQERLVRAAGQTLGNRLGLPNIAGIITDEAATWSDLTYQYLDDPEGGEWLFGPKYAEAVGKSWVYARTKNPTNASGSDVAHVGLASPGRGLGISGWDRASGHGGGGAPLLVVPIENK
ncbi:hypothetical protein HY388_01230 [Candidatus Daviesbacteria bacterium]|nr:hypothetical protein [Candidatus Levybacteria bacterium]MBI4039432.1 hypothetical protein [Candidatus Daviesbacteria bacterium]